MIIENFPYTSKAPTAVALGFFDGVHIAHREIIRGAISCEKEGLIPTVFTFKALTKKAPTGELTTEKEKHDIFDTMGVKLLMEAQFESIKDLSPEEFVRIILKESLNAKKVFCGFNFRFGKNAAGDISSLKKLCEKYHIEVFVTEEFLYENKDVSSTRIKKLLSDGDVAKVKILLSQKYSLEGEIVHGEKLGRKLGAPTLNIALHERKFLPRLGVYAAEVFIDGKMYPAVLNLGKKPTVKGDERITLEAYLLNVSGDFYGEYAKATLVEFLRDEQRFDSLETLKNAIEKDISKAKEIFNA